MKYSNKVISKAAKILYDRRQSAELEAKFRKDEFAKNYPDLLYIENQMALTGLSAIKAIDGCNDPKDYIKKLSQKNLKLQQAKEDLIIAAGYEKDYLKVHYTCSDCNDIGFINGKPCKCYNELLKQLAFKELSECTPLKISKFKDFNVNYYPENTDANGVSIRSKMTDIFNFCKDYADDFDTNSPSLFLFGETGLGKTHLSLAIAGEVIEKGFSVVYGSTQNLLTMIEREHFGRSEEQDGTTEDKLLCCDLLILDDLGAEFTTQFTVAELYNIINSRLSMELPTIINSNITFEELEKRYTNRITSRIIGTYTKLMFCGNDIRQINKNN